MTLSPEPLPPLHDPATGLGSSVSVLERPVEQSYEEGDHERFSHYVPKDKIVESAVTGTPVRALCGKVWVPGRDPQRFPVCPMCKEIIASMGSSDSSE